MLDRVGKHKNVPAVGFRVNGKIGICYVGFEADKCGQDTGYSEWDISEFERDTGTKVPRQQPTSYSWLRENVWEEWLDWRCKRTREFWLKVRDLVRSYREDLKLMVACDLPSETPGYNIEWVNGVSPRELMRHHGYDPELFRQDEGIVIQRGMMIASDRFFGKWGVPLGTNAWAHKAFNYAEGVVECYETPSGQSVEFYHNYWEEVPHPDPQYGPVMRTATAAPLDQFYFEPATYSLRKANVGTMAYMGWERASIGHEHELRRWARTFLAIPYVSPRDFDGIVEVLSVTPGAKYLKPEVPDIWVKWFDNRLVVLNDTGDCKSLRLTIPKPLPKGSCVFDFAAKRILLTAPKKPTNKIVLDIELFEHDLHTLGILPIEEGIQLESKVVPSAGVRLPAHLCITMNRVPCGGGKAVVRILLSNVGRAPLSNVKMRMRLPMDWTTEDKPAEWNIKRFEIGKSVSFSVPVQFPLSSTGNISLVTLTAIYEVSGQRFSEERVLAVRPQPAVSLSISPNHFTDKAAGESMSAELAVDNVAPNPVETALSFHVPPGWLMTCSQNRIVVGAGKSTSAELTMTIPTKAKPGRYLLTVQADAGKWGTESAELIVDVPAVMCKAKGVITIDGNVSDWEKAAPDALVAHTEDFTVGSGDDKLLRKLAPMAKVTWDDCYLYVTCEILGEEFRTLGHGADIWRGDSVQFGIDAGRNSADEDGHYEIGFAWAEEKVETWCWTAPTGASGPAPGIFAARIDGCKQIYEASIRWEDLKPFVAKRGSILGFCLVMNFDRGHGRNYVSWHSGVADTKDPSRFGAVMLR